MNLGIEEWAARRPITEERGQSSLKLRGVAQMEARMVWDHEAGGSSPPTPTIIPWKAPFTPSVSGLLRFFGGVAPA